MLQKFQKYRRTPKKSWKARQQSPPVPSPLPAPLFLTSSRPRPVACLPSAAMPSWPGSLFLRSQPHRDLGREALKTWSAVDPTSPPMPVLFLRCIQHLWENMIVCSNAPSWAVSSTEADFRSGLLPCVSPVPWQGSCSWQPIGYLREEEQGRGGGKQGHLCSWSRARGWK